jgi:hypothetical protein
MSRAHELSRMRLLALIALWQDLTTTPIALGQANRHGYQTNWDRDRIITAILNHENQPERNQP